MIVQHSPHTTLNYGAIEYGATACIFDPPLRIE